MRYRSLPLAALALSSLTLAGCGNEPTEPNGAAVSRSTVPELAVASNTWIARANMPANRTNLAAVTLKNSAGQSIVYAIGGEYRRVPKTTVTAYNVATNTWTFRRALPVALAGTNGAGVIGGKIYISGGYSDWGGAFPNTSLYMYDPATNTWTRKRDIPMVTSVPGVPYSDHYYAMGDGVTGVINNKLYVVSGCFEAQEPWGYFETCNPLFFRYNPVTDQWVRLPSPFAEPASGPSIGGVIAGKFYVMASSGENREARMAVYDPATNKWTPRNALGLARPGAGSAVLGGKLYVVGGSRFNVTQEKWETLNITIVYDPATDAWTRRAPLPSPRTAIAASTVLLNGQSRIEVVGGIAPGNNIQYIP